MNDPFSYTPIPSKGDFSLLRKEFEDGKSLQLISQRSRPGAYLSDSINDPNTSGPGVVEIKVVKAGFLFKLEGKRKNIWRQWGVILTASQLYFFKDTQWFMSNIVNQQGVVGQRNRSSSEPLPDIPAETPTSSFEAEMDADTVPLVMRPLVDGFQPSFLIPTSDIVALTCEDDAPKNRSSMLLAYKGGTTDWFSGPNEADLVDWMVKINFAASFSTFYVAGIKNVIPRHQLRKMRSLRRTASDSTISTHASDVLSIPEESESVQKYTEDHYARRFNVEHKLGDIKAKLEVLEKQIEEQERNGRNLKLLTPLQPRTREAVLMSAATLTATLKWKWTERRKLLCYKEYFEMDLEVENEICETLNPIEKFLLGPSLSPITKIVTNNSPEPLENTSGEATPGLVYRTQSHRRTVSDLSFHTTISRLPDIDDAMSPTSSISSNVFYDSRPGAVSTRSIVSLQSSSDELPSEVMMTSSPKARLRSSSQSTIRSNIIFRVKSLTHRERTLSLTTPLQPSTTPTKGTSEARMPMTLRSPATPKRKPQPTLPQTSDPVSDPALLRKDGEKITIHGRKFELVEVNPEFAASPNHNRAVSLSLSGAHADADLLENQKQPQETEPPMEIDTETLETLATSESLPLTSVIA